MLIDPIACPDLSGLDAALADAEMVLHAATQDLPCLAEIGFRPRRLFDTELAGRLLGYARVGLGTMVESVLGLRLEKGHSAADWSTRPLPEDWLRYAALDVEVLVELRDVLARRARRAGQARVGRARSSPRCSAAPPPAPRSDPWRRTSGIHRVRSAARRSPWCASCGGAATGSPSERDIAPGRVLPDAAIVEPRWTEPRTPAALTDAGHVRRPQRAPAPARAGWPPICAARALPETRAAAAEPARATGRRRPTAGPTATRRPPSGWPPPAPWWPRSPTSTTCRPRTCCSPTRCAG